MLWMKTYFAWFLFPENWGEIFADNIFHAMCNTLQLRIIHWKFIKYSCCLECKYYCMKYRQRLQLNIIPYIQFMSLNLIAIMRFWNTCFDRFFLFFQFDMLEVRFDCNHLEWYVHTNRIIKENEISFEPSTKSLYGTRFFFIMWHTTLNLLYEGSFSFWSITYMIYIC